MSVYGYHHHHGDSLKFFGDNKNNSLPFLGVELEVDSERSIRSDPDDISDYIEDMFPRSFIYFEDDGSLDYGFENITAPATLITTKVFSQTIVMLSNISCRKDSLATM